MCINEPVSWVTLLIGTLVNLTALVLLGKQAKKGQKLDSTNVVLPIAIISLWQYALLMQIPDALAWRNPSANYPGKLAFVLNTTQPLIAMICVFVVLLIMKKSLWRLFLS